MSENGGLLIEQADIPIVVETFLNNLQAKLKDHLRNGATTAINFTYIPQSKEGVFCNLLLIPQYL
jgi:hypothetical protein